MGINNTEMYLAYLTLLIIWRILTFKICNYAFYLHRKAVSWSSRRCKDIKSFSVMQAIVQKNCKSFYTPA